MPLCAPHTHHTRIGVPGHTFTWWCQLQAHSFLQNHSVPSTKNLHVGSKAGKTHPSLHSLLWIDSARSGPEPSWGREDSDTKLVSNYKTGIC